MIKQWMNVNKLKMNAEKANYVIVKGIGKEQGGGNCTEMRGWNTNRKSGNNEILGYYYS